MFGLVGSNGAGKTTTLGIVAGLIRPDRGCCRVLGPGPFDPCRQSGRMGLLPQDAQVPRAARVSGLLAFYARLQGMAETNIPAAVEKVLERVQLCDRGRAAFHTLSHGMKRRVLIAQAFLGDPELILLDEPLSGLDPRAMVRVRELMALRRGDQTVLISSHNLHEMERLCDRVAFIENGKCLRQDAMDAVTHRLQVIRYDLAPCDASRVDCDRLRALLPEAEICLEPETHRLLCRFASAVLPGRNVNRVILQHLLAARVDVCAVLPGQDLEEAYLEQSAGNAAGSGTRGVP